MAERGQHQITSASAGLWAYILVGLLLLGVLYLILSTAWNSIAPSRQQPPRMPLPHTANLESANGDSDLKVVLGEGSYEFVYETATVSTDMPPPGSPGVFYADFSTGKHSGEAAGASTYIFSGEIKLTISDIREQDDFLANLVQSGIEMNAFFSFSQSAGGPPQAAGKTSSSSASKKKIIILGNLAEIVFPTGRGNSKQRITVLDLAASDENYDLHLGPAVLDPLRMGPPREEPESSPAERPTFRGFRVPRPLHVH
jgi:hypothetical protein